ncbi:Rha family transcriptional regulator [Chryseobacterium sp.]|uniref:Rha family transcriptional regulator n=1 Tax=Chryseobacterium sp. TaxID=1871047 RepID=UPI00321A069F
MNAIALTGQQATMSSREIADLTGKRHADVMRDIRIMMDALQQNADLRSVCFSSTYVGENEQSYPQYELDKDTSLTLLLGYDPVARMKVVKRWQELEAAQGPKLPQTMAQALRLAAEQAEQLEEQAARLAIAAPKEKFFDTVVERATLMSATQVAQKLGMSAVAMNKHLDELDVYSRNIKRARVFKQWFIDKGYGELKQTELGYSQPLFTTSGEAWVVERLTSEGVTA